LTIATLATCTRAWGECRVVGVERAGAVPEQAEGAEDGSRSRIGAAWTKAKPRVCAAGENCGQRCT